MALVNVSSALKKDEIRALLEKQESPKYTFVKNKTAIEMQFDVDYDPAAIKDIASYTKKLVQAEPWGKVLMLRVLIEGQAFTGGKI
jgi:hypothetical protein